MHARQRMITQALTLSAVAMEVGYESASQFSREYGRLFGQPPARNVAFAAANLRATA